MSTQSACHLTQLPDRSVDYIFTDPPFGSNINYSEMNYLWESWLGAYTDTREEAIVNKVQEKGVGEYQALLAQAFNEARRVLKDQAWMTVVFHNSSSKVWESLQKAIRDANFLIEGTQLFDKKHGTFKQFVSDHAVGYDLVLHCRKAEQQVNLCNENKIVVRQGVTAFVNRAIETRAGEYVVEYLYVGRAKEFNYRKLYAEWLAEALPKVAISLDFEEFRAFAMEVIQDQLERLLS